MVWHDTLCGTSVGLCVGPLFWPSAGDHARESEFHNLCQWGCTLYSWQGVKSSKLLEQAWIGHMASIPVFLYCSNLLMLGWKSFVWLVFDGIHRCPIWPVVAVCCVYLGNCRYPPSADSSCDRPTIPDNDWLVFQGKRPQVINKVLRWFSTLFQLTWILGRFIKHLSD